MAFDQAVRCSMYLRQCARVWVWWFGGVVVVVAVVVVVVVVVVVLVDRWMNVYVWMCKYVCPGG